jgi:endonuclease/exonuclease/phosphatase family metal-dependent hydrolase
VFRIASYNCQYKIHLSVGFFDRYGQVDAACTQESGTRQQLRENIQNTVNFYSAEAYINDPAVVVTRTYNRCKSDRVIKIDGGLNHHRAALLTELRCGLVLVNVHLTSRNPRRAKEELDFLYETLQKDYKEKPWLIIGDFNHTPAVPPGSLWVKGPQHDKGNFLDWAVAGNITQLSGGNLINYLGSDHAPWYVDVDFQRFAYV